MAAPWLARALGRLWFRRLTRVGSPLPEGPCLILLNHPNGLLDPLAAAALLERPVGWLGKATLWKIAPLRPFLKAFHAIPVTRVQDGGATREALRRCFAQVHEALEAGGSVALFPEGISHSQPDLAPLKTGAARMALSSPAPPALVPVGLVYGDRGAFRHSALLRVGEPIPWEDLLGRGADRATAEALTDRVRAALRPLTLHDADARRLTLAQDLAWLLAEGPGSRADLARLSQRSRALLARLAERSEAELEPLEARVREAQTWLRRQGLRPDQVGHPYAGAEVAQWLPRALGRLALALALAPAAALFLPSWLLVDRLTHRLTDEGDQVATFKLLGGLLLHPLWAVVLAGLGAWRAGWPGALLGPGALLLALLGLPALERVQEDLQAIRGYLRRGDPAIPQLLDARRQLLQAFPELD